MISKLARREPGLLLALFAVVVLFPSANYLLFSGLPLGSPPEIAVLILLLPIMLTRRIRRLYRMALLGRGRSFRLVLLAGIMLALAAKAILLASGSYGGFLACYRSTLNDPPAGTCEKSYENPFSRFNVTRIDRDLNFDAHEWNLSFFNSQRFNFYAWEEGTVSRERLPFEVDWLGDLDLRAEDTDIRITYVGEGIVRPTESESIILAPSYDAPQVVNLQLPAETGILAITYRFDDGYRVGQSAEPGPYAVFSLDVGSSPTNGGEAVSLLAASPSPIWLLLSYGIDLVILAAAVGVVAFYASVLWKDWWILVITVAFGLAVTYLPEITWLPKTRAIVPVFWILFASLMFSRHRRRLFSCYLALAFLSVLRVSFFEPDLGTVQIRGGGTDFLTYESFARAIFESGSLRAGEDIFYYQPLFRYSAFAERLILGDGDGFVAALALLGSAFGVFLLYDRLDINRRGSRRAVYMAGLAGLLLLTLLSSWDIVYFFHHGASEFPTWIMFPYIIVLLFLSKDPRAWAVGVLMAGASILMRPNHALPIMALMLVFYVELYQRRRGLAIAFAALLVTLALLPALHKLIYGGELEFIPRSAGVQENLVLPPVILVTEFGDPDVRAKAFKQIKQLFYFGELAIQTSGLGLALHGLQLIYVITWAMALANWRGLRLAAKILLLLPLFHLGVQFFFVLDAGLSRHILMAHLSMGVAVMFVLSPYGERDGAQLSIAANVETRSPRHSDR